MDLTKYPDYIKIRDEIGESLKRQGLDSEAFDYDIYDPTLTLEENRTIMLGKINQAIEYVVSHDNVKEHELRGKLEQEKQVDQMKEDEIETEFKEKWTRILPQIKSIMVLGTTGSGKTSVSFKVLEVAKEVFKDREFYVYNHPKYKLIEKLGFNNLFNFESLTRLFNAVIYIDEIQNLWKIADHKANEMLAKLLTLARQNDLVLIMSSSMTHFVTRMLEGGIDAFVIKDLDYDGIKQGSRVSKIIKTYSTFDPAFFRLDTDEYLFHCRKFELYSGRKFKFRETNYFNEDLSKAYRNSEKTPTKTPNKSAKGDKTNG